VSSRESWVMGQLTDGSRGSWVKKCDPLSSLGQTAFIMYTSYNGCRFHTGKFRLDRLAYM